MLGTIVNTADILADSGIVCVINKHLDHQMLDKCFIAQGLCCLVIGMNATLSNIPKTPYPTAYILYMVLGTAIGYLFRLENRTQKIKENEGVQTYLKV